MLVPASLSSLKIADNVPSSLVTPVMGSIIPKGTFDLVEVKVRDAS